MLYHVDPRNNKNFITKYNMNINNLKVLILIFLLIETSCRPHLSRYKLEVYRTSNGTTSSRIYSNYYTSDSWNIITQFKYAYNSFFLFYDKNHGKIEILDSNFISVKRLVGMKKSYTIINAIDTNNDGNDELFFYNPGDILGIQTNYGSAEFYSVNNQFQLSILDTNNTYRNSWRDIIAFDFDNDGKRELLFYDPTNTFPDSSTTKIYRVSQNCSLTLINDFSWDKSWEILTPVKIGAAMGLLRYNGSKRTIELLNYDNHKNSFVSLNKTGGYSSEIDKIISGNFGTSNNSDLMFYEKNAEKLTFYSINDNILNRTNEKSTSGSFWEIILPYQIKKTNYDNLIFYQKQSDIKLKIPTYDGSGQVVHPDICKIDNNKYRLVFTPYPWSNDTLENPSILESNDGINFQKIPHSVTQPLVFHPVYKGYEHGHNDDPDYYKYDSIEYIIYQETLHLKGSTPPIQHKNIVLLSSNNNWETFSSSIILKERCSKIPCSVTVSPSIIKKNDTFYLFYVNVTDSTRIQYLSSDNIHDWQFKGNPSEGKNIIMSNSINICPWHINVIFNPYDRSYYMLITGKTSGYSSVGNSLYLAKSVDLINWELSSRPIMTKEDIHGANQIYRSSGIFRDFDQLDIYYSYSSDDWIWEINLRNNFSLRRLFPYKSYNWHIDLRKNYSIKGIFPLNAAFNN
jgi:hypothetical protein